MALVALIGAIVIVYLVLAGGGGGYKVTAHFENASQLVNGNEVVVGGTPVGLVDEIRLGDRGEAIVTFDVDAEYAPLPRGTTATVRQYSLSGVANRQISLTLPPSNEAGEPIPDGGELSQAETVSAVDLDHIFNMLDDETVANLKKVIRGFEISYDGVARQANEGIRYLNPFLSTSRRLFAEITRLTGALAERRDDVAALVGNVNESMGALARQRTALAATVRGLPNFMRNFNTTAVNLRATLDDLDPLVDASKPVATRLRPFFANFRAASANLVPTIRDLDRVVSRPGNNNDLIELTRLQVPLAEIAVGPVRRNGARRAGAFPESARSLRDSLEQLAFFRAYTPELVGWFDDFGHSGIIDANGGIGRIGTTFNTFSVSPAGFPIIDILSGPPFGAQGAGTQFGGLSTGNLQRCPGSNERPSDQGNPFTEGGSLDCDPSQIPPGP